MKLLSVFPVHISYFRSSRHSTLEGPTLVLAEAEHHDCKITEVYVSRLTDAALIGSLQRTLPKGTPILEVAAAELDAIAGGRVHGGVAAALRGKPRHKRRLEKWLWSMLRLGIPTSAQRPQRFDG